MNTEAIELICEKLGTTIEYLVPAVIEYKLHLETITLIIGICIAVFGIFSAIAAKFVSNHVTYENDLDIVAIVLCIIAVIGIVAGLLMIITQAIQVHMWKDYPTIQAYEFILKWIGKG